MLVVCSLLFAASFVAGFFFAFNLISVHGGITEHKQPSVQVPLRLRH